MKPETIRTLQENYPEFIELRAFLTSELLKLYSLEDLDALPAAERSLQLEGKLWAYKTLGKMLAPLLAPQEQTGGLDPKEYAVDVD